MRTVTMKGNPLTLFGKELKVGDKAPDATLMDNDLSPLKISSFKGKALLIISVPSLDTSVCSLETRRFNKEMDAFGNAITTLVISMDLPFAQKRWCGAEGAKTVKTLSDYRSAEFGEKYGVLIQDLRLLARTIFIVDAEGVIRFTFLVQEVTNEPPYEEILGQVKQFLSKAK